MPGNGGKLPFMECVKWLSADALVAAGPPGVYFSKDKGNNWSELYEDGFHAMGVSVKGHTGWLAGDNGKVVKFTW